MRESALAAPEILSASRSRPQGRQLARYQSNPRKDCTAKPIWMRGISVLLIASIAGCGTAPVTAQSRDANQSPEPEAAKPAPYRLPPGAKVALAVGQFDPTITFIESTAEYNGPSAGAHAAKDTVECVGRALIQTMGLFLPLCAILVPVAGVLRAASEAQSIGAINNYPETPSDNALTAQEVETQKLAAAIKSGPLERSLLALVQRRALEHGLPEWAILPRQTTQMALSQPQYQDVADYVFEISVTGLELGWSSKDVYWIRFNGRGRLLRANDNVAVDNFATRVATRLTFDRRQAETGTLTVLNSALQDIAASFVDRYASAPAAPVDAQAPKIFETISCTRPDGVEVVTTRISCVRQGGIGK